MCVQQKKEDDAHSKRCGLAFNSSSVRGTDDKSFVCKDTSVGVTPWSSLGMTEASLKVEAERSETKFGASGGMIDDICSEVRPMLGRTKERKKRVKREIPSSL